jgi:hypothetical protein
MLAGNVVAFAGTLINADFRREWWPLACAHVAHPLVPLAFVAFVLLGAAWGLRLAR